MQLQLTELQQLVRNVDGYKKKSMQMHSYMIQTNK